MFKIATFNLYHFAAPPIWWYERAPSERVERAPRFTAAEWAAKTDWVSATLTSMDADVVGFQEVVSVDALKAIAAEAGYPYFETVAEPRLIDDAGEPVYVRPVQAIASRHPMRVERPIVRTGFAAAFGRGDDWDFRRPPVKAWIDAPSVGAAVVYCAHLKSPGVAVGDVPIAGATDPERADLEALSRAHAFATIQRAMEASALFHDAASELARDRNRLVALVGDFNDGPDTPTLRALTPDRPEERDGGAATKSASPSRYRFIDAYRLAPRDAKTDRRPPTHRTAAHGDAIDFVLVSHAAHPNAADQRFAVVEHRVVDDHFYASDPRRTSDHAPVVTTLRRV